MTYQKTITQITILILSITLCSCRKVKTPDENLKNLFGKWKLVDAYGYAWGSQVLPNQTYEFKENGKFINENGYETKQKAKYSFESDTYNSDTYFIIRYKNRVSIKYKEEWLHRIVNLTKDSLHLQTWGCYDCEVNWIFIKE